MIECEYFQTLKPSFWVDDDGEVNGFCFRDGARFEAVDWSDHEGLWTPCSGSVTPWNTHLGSEEISPDARQVDVKDMMVWDTNDFKCAGVIGGPLLWHWAERMLWVTRCFLTLQEWDVLRNNSDNNTPEYLEEMMRYFGVYPDELTTESLGAFHPYMYGFPWEFDVSEDGSYTIVKHMAMGRTSIELPYVMPDNKTVYITDDGQNRVFTMFIADK